MTKGHVQAPFTRMEVWSLNAFQDSGLYHPYTCPDCNASRDRRLVATSLGWVCRNHSECQYTQNWAHDFTANWKWKRDFAIPVYDDESLVDDDESLVDDDLE